MIEIQTSTKLFKKMEQKEILGLMLVTNFNKFAEFHAISSQKLGKFEELVKF